MNQRNWKAHLASAICMAKNRERALFMISICVLDFTQMNTGGQRAQRPSLSYNDTSLSSCLSADLLIFQSASCVCVFVCVCVFFFFSSPAACTGAEAVSDHNTLWWISAFIQWNEVFDWFLIYFPHQWWKYSQCMQLHWGPLVWGGLWSHSEEWPCVIFKTCLLAEITQHMWINMSLYDLVSHDAIAWMCLHVCEYCESLQSAYALFT